MLYNEKYCRERLFSHMKKLYKSHPPFSNSRVCCFFMRFCQTTYNQYWIDWMIGLQKFRMRIMVKFKIERIFFISERTICQIHLICLTTRWMRLDKQKQCWPMIFRTLFFAIKGIYNKWLKGKRHIHKISNLPLTDSESYDCRLTKLLFLN